MVTLVIVVLHITACATEELVLRVCALSTRVSVHRSVSALRAALKMLSAALIKM